MDILRNERKLEDYDMSGISLRKVDLSGVRISGCSLKGVRFHGVILKEAAFQLVFGDFAEMRDSDFSGSTFRNSVFSGSLIEGCRFENCDLFQCNFMGVIARCSHFNHSNLYASRFLEGEFDSVGMKDCNLTRARFTAGVKGIDFSSSNLNEARFVEEGR